MGLEINTKEELKDLIESLKNIGLNEITIKIPNLELTIKSNSPSTTYNLTDEEKIKNKKDDNKATASQLLEIFSEGVEELNTDAR